MQAVCAAVIYLEKTGGGAPSGPAFFSGAKLSPQEKRAQPEFRAAAAGCGVARGELSTILLFELQESSEPFFRNSCGKVTHITCASPHPGSHLRTRRLLRPLGLVSSIARMIRIDRLPVVLLITLGFAVALLGCDSGSSEGSGGSGGTGGSNDGPLRILVTNDDGVGAPGIDAVVEALKDDPDNVVTVCAPAVERSSTGDMTTPTPPPLQATETTTASGYPATAVDGFPADSVIYALENLFPNDPPHVVLSGINSTQNVGAVPSGQLSFLSGISGTVGAAKTAACLGVPALASSQGQVDENGTVDYPAGLAEVLLWLEANRSALLAGEVAVENITSINIPSCDGEGEIRGTLEVPLATENPNGYLINGPQDCTSTLDDVPNDIEAFFNGYSTITPIPRNALMTCDDLN